MGPRLLGRAVEPIWIRFGPALAGTGGAPVRTLLQTPSRIDAAHAALLRIAGLGAAELRFELGAAPLISQRAVAERMHALYAAPP